MTRHTATFTPGDLTRRRTTRPPPRDRRSRRGEEQPARVHAEGPGAARAGRAGTVRPGHHCRAGTGIWRRRTIPAHQATSQHIAGIYPFVADSGLGHRGPILGVDLNADALWHFSPWESYVGLDGARHVLHQHPRARRVPVRASPATVKTLVTRSIAFGHQVVVPSDPKGEWVAVAEAIPGGRVIRLGGGTGARLNPLDRGPRRSDVDR